MADNPLAFPSGWPDHGLEPVGGMFLRDWFAGQALTSTMSLVTSIESEAGETMAQTFARKAYVIADAMLAERERT